MSQPHSQTLAGGDAAELAQFGYTQSMERRTGRFASFAVAFAFVSIATGIFTTYGSVLNSSGPVGIWTWPIAVVGQLAVAFVLGSLASRIPVTGYAYQWMSRLANPVLGWIIGWISFTFLAIVVVAVDYTIASTVLPVLLSYDGTTTVTWLVTALVLLAQALLVGMSTKWSERVNSGAVSAELIGMLALTVLLLVVGFIRGDMNVANLWSKGAVAAEGFWSFGGWTSAGPWMLGFLLGAFTIVGFESAANLAEETTDPERVVPRAMVQAVLASGVLGFVFLIAVTLAAGDPVALAAVGNPDRRRHQAHPGIGGVHAASGDGGRRDLRLRIGHHDDRGTADLGDVARRTLPRLEAVESDLRALPHPAQGHRHVLRPRRADPRRVLPVAERAVHPVRCRHSAARGDLRRHRGALPDQAQAAARQRQVRPWRLGEAGPDRRGGVAGLRTRPVPRRQLQERLAVRSRR